VIADKVARLWGEGAAWQHVNEGEPHEAELLALDARRAQVELGWRNYLDLDTSLAWTVDWTRSWLSGDDARLASLAQVEAFETLSSKR